eukprot:scaffold37754_cov124-Skeletonema_marinoi.AAC.2
MNANTNTAANNKPIPFNNNTIVMYQPSAARSLQCRPTTRCLLGLVNWSVEEVSDNGGRTDAGI